MLSDITELFGVARQLKDDGICKDFEWNNAEKSADIYASTGEVIRISLSSKTMDDGATAFSWSIYRDADALTTEEFSGPYYGHLGADYIILCRIIERLEHALPIDDTTIKTSEDIARKICWEHGEDYELPLEFASLVVHSFISVLQQIDGCHIDPNRINADRVDFILAGFYDVRRFGYYPYKEEELWGR